MATILLVDDSPIILRMVGFTLRQHGHDVIKAYDGTQALPILRDTKIDLVISDISMGEMDGITLLHNVRHMPGKRNLPFILYTANEITGPQRRFALKSANKVLTKPASSLQIMDSVNALLS